MKKLLAVVLSLALALGLGASAFAEDESETLERLASYLEEHYPAEYAELEADLENILDPIADGSLDELDLPLIELLVTELTDDDSLDDFEALVQYLRLIGEGGYTPGDLRNALKAIAVIDALDDDSTEDYEKVLDYIELIYDTYGFSRDELSEELSDELEAILTAITDEDYIEADHLIPELLLAELTDNLNIDDLDFLWRIVELYFADDYSGEYTTEITELLKALALFDFYDDYSDDDFNMLLEHIRLSDGNDGGTLFNDTADEILHLAWILNSDGIENDPLTE